MPKFNVVLASRPDGFTIWLDGGPVPASYESADPQEIPKALAFYTELAAVMNLLDAERNGTVVMH